MVSPSSLRLFEFDINRKGCSNNHLIINNELILSISKSTYNFLSLMNNSSERNKRLKVNNFKFKGQNGTTCNNNNVDIYKSYKRNSSVGHHHPKISNAGNSIHHPLATSNGVVGHVGLMSNSSHGRVGGHGSKIPSR